jgi:hypothetical protein
MPKRKKPKLTDQEQYALFLETAKAVEAEDAKEKFEETCEKILKVKRPVNGKREND